MASEINVDKITPQTGTTLELGDSGDTITVTGTLDGSGLTGLNADNLTSGTVPDARFPATLPAASGANLTGLPSANLTGALPAIDGSALTGIETGTDWQSTIVTGTTLTAVAGRGYWIDTTSNQCTITFPSSASVGDTIELVDYARTWGTNKIIIDSNGLNYQGEDDTYAVEYSTNGQALRVVYSGATKGWIPTSDDDVTDAPVDPNYNVDFLVIAGGGGGGSARAGGGGAGGYRNSYNSETSGGGGSSETAITVTLGTQYTVTVGAGGGDAVSGSNSVFSTITSIGGGRGGSVDASGSAQSGGSGGGGGGLGAATEAGASGTANQGFAGGHGYYTGGQQRVGGGGGGASAVGVNGASNDAGEGGNGLASSITGSSTTRAGGGGGGVQLSGEATGGTGGGGTGGRDTTVNATNGTTNTGSGGGGGGGDGGSGGSGIVILRMATAKYSGTTTGSPSVTTSGSDTILTYTGSGSYTA